MEQKFEIIGEALRRLSKLGPGLAPRIPDIRDVIAFRNVSIHGYAAIEHVPVWRIADTSLPALRTAPAALAGEMTPPETVVS